MRLEAILEKTAAGRRLDEEEIVFLLGGGGEEASGGGKEPARSRGGPRLAVLGALAHRVRMGRADPSRVTFVVDRNINYTNVCVSGCRFCAFFRPPGHPEAYVLSRDELGAKIAEARSLGASQILLQGGMHPGLGLSFFEDMLRFIKKNFPAIHVHGFSPPEIVHVASVERTGIARVISRLEEAGLDSIPGGGAEILTEASRRRVSPRKCSARQWLDVMREAHRLGIKTSATMMFGHGESVRERAAHLLALRGLQDETGGFTAFIPWSFQPANTRLDGLAEPGGHEYLRVLAASRLALDNFDNIQASWVTQGAKVAQVALFFGANDFGSTMIEENVVAAAGVRHRVGRERIESLIRRAGFRPAVRNQAYEILEEARGPDREEDPRQP